ncbi:hypothetical protein KY315_04365 [Candidatus Woesearchaeota archaeon]|nr:hypothetical protein [Candidatus Woesearchaeota archaeon]
MTERMITMLDSVDVAVAEAPVKPTEKTNIAKTTKTFCVEVQEEWHPVKLPANFRVEDLLNATGAHSVYELQYDTVINRYKEMTQGDIQPHHVYTLCGSKKKQLTAFLNACEIIN